MMPFRIYTTATDFYIGDFYINAKHSKRCAPRVAQKAQPCFRCVKKLHSSSDYWFKDEKLQDVK